MLFSFFYLRRNQCCLYSVFAKLSYFCWLVLARLRPLNSEPILIFLVCSAVFSLVVFIHSRREYSVTDSLRTCMYVYVYMYTAR